MDKETAVLIGTGSIGVAIVRGAGIGRTVLLADALPHRRSLSDSPGQARAQVRSPLRTPAGPGPAGS